MKTRGAFAFVTVFISTSLFAAAGCSGDAPASKGKGDAPSANEGGALATSEGGALATSEGSAPEPDAAADAEGAAANTTDAQVEADAPTQDGASCSIVARSYDPSCAADSDCAIVVAGGNVCDPCAAPEFFVCPTAVMNAVASQSYNAALQAALGRPAGIMFSAAQCGVPVSCPVFGTARCQAGTCALVIP